MKRDDLILLGDKGGGGSSFREEDNSLKSLTWVKTLEGLGYGLQLGPVGGKKSVYLDDTPVVAADGSENFKDVLVDFRYGTPSQAVIKGFEDAGSVTSVATAVTVAAPVTRTVSSASVGAVAVTIRLPNGLYNQNTSSNALEKTTLNFLIKTKLTSSGTWITATNKTYTDKATGPFEESFYIPRPAGTGTWDIRIERVTADSAASTLRNDLQFAYFTEYLTDTVTYPNVALMSIQLNASGVNSSRVPVRSVDWYGRIVQVPSVFNPQTATYSGVWDMVTFKSAWTSDPAWVLYDIATDGTVGLGLSASQVDIASFYAASQYNCQQVAFTGDDGVTYSGPRFTFNGQLTDAMSAVDWLKKVAAVMNSTVLWVNGQLTVKQDRPDTFAFVFTNANVVGGKFSRGSTSYENRITAVNVTWTAPSLGYKPAVVSVSDTAAIAQYGLQESNVAAFGCTSLSQAKRYGKWLLDSAINTTGTVTFTVGEIGALVVPGDVIRIFDNTYAQVTLAGRLLAGSTTTSLVLDRSVTLTAGSKVTIWNTDGTVYADMAVTTTGTVSTITLTSAMGVAPAEGAIFQFETSAVAPETYRVISREEVEPGKFQLTAGEYDTNKWTRIEGGVTHAKKPYTLIPEKVNLPPTGLTFTERSIYVDLAVQRVVHVAWTPPVGQTISGYRVTYTLNGGNKVVEDVKLPFIEIDAMTGSLQVMVQTLSYLSLTSSPVTGSYTIAATETTGSALSAPTGLYVLGTASTTFSQPDLIVQWTNPAANGSTTSGVARFKVEVYNGATLLRTEYVDPVGPGAVQTYTYPYQANLADGGPRRSLIVKVYCQEPSLKLSAAATATFTNAAPAAPSGLAVTGGVGQVFVTFTQPTDVDLKGTLVWASLSAGFTPASGNLVYDGSDGVITFKTLGTGTHYVKVAHYDSFQARDYTGTGLNISAQQTATPLASAGIPSGSANPGSGTQGDLFFNTTDNKLYRYTGSAWTAAVPTLDLTGTITTTQITDNAVTTAKVASNSITTNKLFVTGQGQNLNADPNMLDLTAWAGGNTPLLVTGITDLPGGSTAFTNQPNILSTVISTDYIAVDSSTNYYLDVVARQTSGTAGTAYLGVVWFDGLKAQLTATGATGWPSNGTGSYFGIWGTALPTTWTRYTASFGPDETFKSHPSTKFVKLIAFLNYNNTAGSVCAVGHFGLMRKTKGEVIVDGTLAAAKLVANSITAGQIAASTITGSNIAANTISATNIAGNTITASKIAAGTITANEIADTTITGSKLVDATVTNAKVGGFLQSVDFNGTIVNDQITNIGTAGWAIAKGNSPGTSSMVIDAANIRNQLTIGQLNITPARVIGSNNSLGPSVASGGFTQDVGIGTVTGTGYAFRVDISGALTAYLNTNALQGLGLSVYLHLVRASDSVDFYPGGAFTYSIPVQGGTLWTGTGSNLYYYVVPFSFSWMLSGNYYTGTGVKAPGMSGTNLPQLITNWVNSGVSHTVYAWCSAQTYTPSTSTNSTSMQYARLRLSSVITELPGVTQVNSGGGIY